jgi:Rha family phage regulatory protein
MKEQFEIEQYLHCPVVVVEEKHALTTSLNVARYFGKNHFHVCRDIENLKASEGMPVEFWASNFGGADYVDSRGKVQRMYRMNRSGFTLLVMGYTGPKALRYKIAYIRQFDAMEAYIQEPHQRELISIQGRVIDAQGLQLRFLTRKANKISPKEVGEMVELWMEGDLTVTEIAARMYRSRTAVTAHLKEARKAGRLERKTGQTWLFPEVE